MSDVDLGNLGNYSRAYLEPVMAKAEREGDYATADAIFLELGTRTWQWHNPYAPA